MAAELPDFFFLHVIGCNSNFEREEELSWELYPKYHKISEDDKVIKMMMSHL